MAAVAREVIEAYGDAQRLGDGQSGRHRAVPAQGVAARAADRARGESELSRRALSRQRRSGRPRAARDDAGQEDCRMVGRIEIIDHRGIESAAARVRERRARLRQRAGRADLATCSTPDQKLKPELAQARHARRHAASQPAVVVHLLQHGGPGRRRLHHRTRSRCAARSAWLTTPTSDHTRRATRARRCPRRSRFRRTSRPRSELQRRRARTTPRGAKALLDKFGYIDRDGDGWRELPDGKPLVAVDGVDAVGRDRECDELWQEEPDGGRHPDRIHQAEVARPAEDGHAPASCRCGASAGSRARRRTAMRSCELLYSPNIGQIRIYARFACPSTTSCIASRALDARRARSAKLFHRRCPSSSPPTTRGSWASIASRTRSCSRGCRATR